MMLLLVKEEADAALTEYASSGAVVLRPAYSLMKSSW